MVFGLAYGEFLAVSAVAVLWSAVLIVPAVRICRRLGFNAWLGAIAIIPVANVLLLWFIALSPWPRDGVTRIEASV